VITSQGLLRSPRVLLSILGLLCVASCGAGAAGAPGVSAASAPPPIAWQSWSAEAFARARRQHKLVLVDVGIEGCTACRWMEEATYADPRVRVRLAAHFVTIQVDADVRPDLGERFSRWGWPATVFFSPEGEQVLAVRGNKRPPTFLPILDDLISRAEHGRLSPMNERAVAQAAPEESELGQLCLAASHMSDSFARARHGGYDARVQHVRDAPLRLDFLRGQIRGDEPRLNHALRTAEGYTQLLDPVWGGVFVASTAPDWSSPIRRSARGIRRRRSRPSAPPTSRLTTTPGSSARVMWTATWRRRWRAPRACSTRRKKTRRQGYPPAWTPRPTTASVTPSADATACRPWTTRSTPS